MTDDDDIRIFLRDQSREWLLRVSESTGWSINAIAKRAGVSVANLNKLVNQPDFPHPMSETVKIKIARATGQPLPGNDPQPTPTAQKPGLKEPEAKPYMVQPTERTGKNGADWWEIGTDLLDSEGILKGDLVEVDLNAAPKPNDCVIAQMTVGTDKQTVTIFRKFEPPMLTCHTTARNYPRPEYVDGERIIIMGVVTEVRRVLRTSAA
tara:strand:- start:5103 stop:5726 length:624 start_codon:yes stop_codon:yes gene_type:complete